MENGIRNVTLNNEGECINLKLLFNAVEMIFFARVFYLSPGLFYYYFETTSSRIYKKKLFHLFSPTHTHAGTPSASEPEWPRHRQIPLHTLRLGCVEDPVLSSTVHLAELHS